jgi:hypothetical protein
MTLEVSQGIQNLENEMPLIEGRPTIVRAYVSLDTNQCNQYEFVGANLVAFQGQVQSSPILPENYSLFSLKPNGGDRNKLNDSLWFTLPPEWRHATAGLGLDLELTVLNKSTNDTEIFRQYETVRFLPSQELMLLMTPLHLHPLGDPTMTPREIALTSDVARVVEGIYRYLPVEKVSILEHPMFYPPLHGNANDHFHEWNLQDVDGKDELLDDLIQMRLYENYPDYVRIVGMVHPLIPTGDLAGLSRPTAGVLWVQIDPTQVLHKWINISSAMLAHELAHIAGLRHVYCNGNEYGVDPNYPWPKTATKPCSMAEVDPKGYYGLDVFGDSGSPSVISNDPFTSGHEEGYPLMSYREDRWISPYEYCKLLIAFGVPCPLDGTWPPAPPVPITNTIRDTQIMSFLGNMEPAQPINQELFRSNAPAVTYVSVIGRLDSATSSATIRSLSYLQSTPNPVGTLKVIAGYKLVLLDGDGNELAAQDIHQQDSEQSNFSRPFWEVLPLPAGVQRIQVRQGQNVLAERIASSNPPSVTLTSPNSGTLTAGTVITWSASDPDGDPLSFDLLYSRNGGQTWTVLALGLEQTSFTLTSLDGIGGTNQGILRLSASDGFHVSRDDADGVLSTPDQKPLVLLTGDMLSGGSAVYLPGQTVNLRGFATDLEDGPLSGSSLSWTSNRDGALGSGDELFTRTLSSGLHTITLTATDSVGNQNAASMTVFIGHRIFIPLVLRQ